MTNTEDHVRSLAFISPALVVCTFVITNFRLKAGLQTLCELSACPPICLSNQFIKTHKEITVRRLLLLSLVIVSIIGTVSATQPQAKGSADVESEVRAVFDKWSTALTRGDK